MKQTKDKKIEIKKLKLRLTNLMKACNKDYDALAFALKEIFTKITDANNPRLSEFNETYKIYELAECKCIALRKFKMNKIFGQARNICVQAEVLFYDKAPKGIVILLVSYDKNINKHAPVHISLYIDEN